MLFPIFGLGILFDTDTLKEECLYRSIITVYVRIVDDERQKNSYG